MKKTLRADFYKLFKSKTGISFLVIISCICVGLRTFFIASTHGGGMQSWSSGEVSFLVIVFMAIFVCRDFSSGLFKSTKRATSSLNWLLSKAIVLLTFVAFYSLLHFLYSAILEFGYNFGRVGWHFLLGWDALIPNGNNLAESISRDYTKLWVNELYTFVNAFGIGMGCLALCCWCRNLIVCMVVPSFYLFIGGFYIHSAIASIFGVELSTIKFFTVMTGTVLLGPTAFNELPAVMLVLMSTHVVFILITFGLSWLAMCKREVR